MERLFNTKKAPLIGQVNTHSFGVGIALADADCCALPSLKKWSPVMGKGLWL